MKKKFLFFFSKVARSAFLWQLFWFFCHIISLHIWCLNILFFFPLYFFHPYNKPTPLLLHVSSCILPTLSAFSFQYSIWYSTFGVSHHPSQLYPTPPPNGPFLSTHGTFFYWDADALQRKFLAASNLVSNPMWSASFLSHYFY